MHPGLHRPSLCRAPLLVVLMLIAPLGAAQIRTDASLGHGAQSLTGPAFTIPQSLGLLSGPNLFQSFSIFNLAPNESANFTTTSAGISNVISRVTGGTASSIQGTLALSPAFGAPNLFFINPAGVTFASGASINVPGAFHVSTANYLKFADGRFYSDLGHTSSFSTLAPEAFGFLGTTRAPIAINDNSFLGVCCAPISIVAGDVSVNFATVATFGGGDIVVGAVGADKVEVPLTGALPSLHGTLSIINGGSINALATSTDSGAIRVSAGNVMIDSSNSGFFTGINADTPSGSAGNAKSVTVAASGSMTLSGSGMIGTSSESSGSAGLVVVDVGGALSLASGARINSQASDVGNALGVEVNAGSITINGQGGVPIAGIESFASAGTGNAGPVRVNSTGNITVENGGFIGGSSFTPGNGSSVTVSAKGNLLVINEGAISSDADNLGAAGNVSVNAANITLIGASNSTTGISSSSQTAQSGAAGNVAVTTPGALVIESGSQIASNTQSAHDAGQVSVDAGSISINGENVNVTTGITSIALKALGNAGSISVSAKGALSIVNGGEIDSGSVLSLGGPGRIVVNAGSLFIDGEGNHGGAGISTSSNSFASGRDSDVLVNVSGQLTILSGGFIDADAFLVGNGGAVRVNAGNLTIDGQGTLETGITSQAFSGAFTANAGSVEVDARGTLEVLNAGVISSSTGSRGHAGSVVVNARDIVVEGAHSTIDAAAFFTSSGQTGNVSVTALRSLTIADSGVLSILNSAHAANPHAIVPSELIVSAPDITLSRGGLINAASTGNVDAGNILINFSDVMRLDPSAITTATLSGNGGSITIRGGSALILDQSAIITSGFGASGNGGDIFIKADVLVLDSGFIQANTAAANASGGTVRIDVESLLASQNSLFVGGNTPFVFDPSIPGFNVIQAAAPTGLSGVIDISTPVLNLSGSLSALGVRLLDRGALGRNRCQTSGGSSLALAGRGGFAPAARELLHAEPSAEALASAELQPRAFVPAPLALASWGCTR
jgi:filamentous hemagglutinin family protein